MNRRELVIRAAGLGAALALPDWAWASTDPRLKSLARAVRGRVLARSSAGYAAARLQYDSLYDPIRPLAVVQPVDAADVAAVVRWAARTGVRIVARSGGHSYGGYSTVANGVVVDLQRLRSVSVSQGRALVGAGARLGNIYATLGVHGLAIPAGTCPSVGIGGHVLGGGFGLASRGWGLASDNLLAVQMVTADGKVIVADAKHHPDLFWALRGGGGGNFGIATRFTFRTHPVARGSYFVASWPWARAADVLAGFLEWAPHQPDALGALCRLAAGPGGPTIQVFGQYLGSESALTSVLASLHPPASRLRTGTAGWLDLVKRWAGCLGHPLPECALPGHTAFAGGSDYLTRVPTRRELATFAAVIESRGASSGALLVDAYGGAINRVKPGATAFVHRKVLASIQYYAGGAGARAWVDSSRDALRPAVSGAAYVNYIDPHLADWQQAYYGANLPRLRAVKKKIDPHDLFHFPQSIRA